MTGRLEIDGTDLEVVAYVNAGGNLVVRVNKAGICVMDAGLLNAGDTFSPEALMNIGALTRPILRDMRKPDVLDMLKEPAGA
jgi:hypothetical protein